MQPSGGLKGSALNLIANLQELTLATCQFFLNIRLEPGFRALGRVCRLGVSRRGLLALTPWVVVALSACSTPPRHPVLAAAADGGQLPELLPVRRFVANVDYAGAHQLSPDGRQLLALEVVGTDIGLSVRDRDGGAAARTYPVGNMGRQGGRQYWVSNSRHVVYTKDPLGNENTQLWVQDTHNPAFEPWQVMPGAGVRSVLVSRGETGSSRFLLASNRRDRSTFDLYEADAATRSVREVARSDGSVRAWLIGVDRQLAGRVRQLGPQDGADLLIEWLDASAAGAAPVWRSLRTIGGFDAYLVPRMDVQRGKAWVSHNLARDKLAVFEVDLKTGAERLIAADDRVDVSWALFAAGRGGPIGVVVEPGYPQAVWLDLQRR